MEANRLIRIKGLLGNSGNSLAFMSLGLLFMAPAFCQENPPENRGRKQAENVRKEDSKKDDASQDPAKTLDQTQTQDQTKKDAGKKPEPEKPIPLLENIKTTIEVGVQIRQLSGDRPGKFQETREVPNGFYLNKLSFDFNPEDSPYFVFLKGREIRELDQRFRVEAGRFGKYRTAFRWDQIPHSFSDGRSLHQSTRSGLLEVSPALRARLAGVPTAGEPPQRLGAVLPALVREELRLAPVIDLRLRWDEGFLRQSYQPSDNMELFFQVRRLRSRGSRPKGTGTFARQNIGPTVLNPNCAAGLPACDAVWEALGIELPEPIDYRTTDLTVGSHFSGMKWRVGMDYDLSLFRNRIGSLTWENPFRITDALGNPPGSAVGRNRFVRAQLALPPSNTYHSFSLRGGFDLPRKTQMRGSFSWGRGTQNEPFLPYTLNSAMVASLLPAGQPPIFSLNPPQPDLTGVIRTLNHDYALVSRPWNSMRFRLQYRAHDTSNQSPIIEFPGFQSFGDSVVHYSLDYYGLPIENFPTSFLRQNTTAGWRWDVSDNFTWNLEYDWEVWNRTFRDVPRSNEHSIRSWFDFKPLSTLKLKADYRYADRKPRVYLTQPLVFNPAFPGSPPNGPQGAWVVTPETRLIRGLPLEANILRRFDEGSRMSNDGTLSVELLREKSSFSASYRYVREDYDKNFLGLHYNVLSLIDTEFTYAAQERHVFYVNYSRDQNHFGYRGLGSLIAGATLNVTPCCAQYPIANTWDRSTRTAVDSFQFGITSASEDGTTILDLSYALAFAKDKTHAVNPFPIRPDSPLTAGAYNYPDTLVQQQEVILSLTRQLRAGLKLGVRYLFEPYKLDDFYFNDLQPYAFGLIKSGGVSVNVPRYILLNSRFTTSHAHVASTFLQYSF